MSTRIWTGRCEDCYDERPLTMCTGEILPEGMSAKLCEHCKTQRVTTLRQGNKPAPVGLFSDETWIDMPSIVVICGDERIIVSVKNICRGRFAGITRIRFDDRPQWFPAGVFGIGPARVRSEAMFFLRKFYFQGQHIRFE